MWPGGFQAGDRVHAGKDLLGTVASHPASGAMPGYVPVELGTGGLLWSDPSTLKLCDSEFIFRVPSSQHPRLKMHVIYALRRVNAVREKENLEPMKLREWLTEAVVEKLEGNNMDYVLERLCSKMRPPAHMDGCSLEQLIQWAKAEIADSMERIEA